MPYRHAEAKECIPFPAKNCDGIHAIARRESRLKTMVMGSLNIDHVYRVAHFTQPGVTVRSCALDTVCGGKGLNQSIAIQNGGTDVLLAGCVGKADSDQLFALLHSKGVDTHLIARKDLPTGHTVIQVNDAGENSILLCGGANDAVDDALIDRALAELNPADLLVMQNEIAQMPSLMTKAHAKGIRLVFNASPLESMPDSLPLDKVDLFFLNEHEAKVLARTEAHVESALLRQYPEAKFVITCGARGAAVVAHSRQRLWADALKVLAVDTTGAGDTFLGYFVSRMASGSTDEECLRYATQAAALCVQRHGAAPAIPLLAEVKRALAGQQMSTELNA
jgi:ribokinase